MKFDLFKAMNTIEKEFGNSGELLLTRNGPIMAIRVVVHSKKEFYNSEFIINTADLLTESLIADKFVESITKLKHIVDNCEKQKKLNLDILN